MNTAAKTAEAWIPEPVTITKTITDDDFASRLELIRHHMGWNVKEAARECGLPAATWRLWEVNGALPRNIVSIAMVIATRVGCDNVWLVHGPDRGGARPTTGYAATPHVIARIGEDRTRARVRSVHTESPTRPVIQTRPIRRGANHPETPVAV